MVDTSKGNVDRWSFLKGSLAAGTALDGGSGLLNMFGNPMGMAVFASEPRRGGVLIHGI